MEGQRRGRSIAMTDPERDGFLAEQRTARVATVDGRGRPHVTPLWFVWHDRAIWLWSLVRSSRFAHLVDNPEAAVVVDAGEAYAQLRGVELRGRVEVVGGAPRTATDHPELVVVEEAFAAKYRSGRPPEPDGKHAWLALQPRAVVSWDFRKLP